MADFQNSLFSFDMTEAEAGALLAYTILIVKHCQQRIYDFLLSCLCAAERDGSYCSNVGVQIIQQLEQSIDRTAGD